MASKETIHLEVKSDIGKVSKEAEGAAGNIAFMGVSLNSVKAGFKKLATTAKASFATIRAGIMSTGIGALLIAVTSLVTYFTNTKRGADKLSQAFAGISAVASVLTDRLSKVGEAISYVFSGEFRKAGEALKGTFAGIADEIEREVTAMVELEKRTQRLRDADNAFMVQKAATRQEIEKARLIAEDETKSAKERLTNLKKALELEAETTKQEIELAKERVAIQREEMLLSENMAEDEEKLAQLKVALIETETASIKMRRRVVTEVNALEREIHAEEKARAKEKQDILDAEFDAMVKANEEWNVEQAKKFAKTAEEDTMLLELQQQNSLAAIENLKERALAELEIQEEKELTSAELMENSEEMKAAIAEKYTGKRAEVEKKFNTDKKKWSEMSSAAQLDIMSSTAGNMIKILGEETAAGKAMAVTQATIDTYKGATAAYAAMASIPYVGPVLGGIAAAAAVAAGLANVKAILSADASGGGSGGGAPSTGGASAQAPAPEMLSGKFELGGGMEPEPLKAFVVTDEMTNSQDQLANIRRRATV
jgi:uncharacterized SAM-binding protein YcdF (DUF218 family)